MSGMTPSNLPPEIAVAIAIIAFIGVAINVFVVARNAKKQRALERELRAHEAYSTAELEVLRTRLASELKYKEIFIKLNEANWKRVHSNISTLKGVGFETLSSFKELAGSGHELSDQEVIVKSEAATALRARFRKAVDVLRAEIRPEDYARLEELLEFLMKVFLDIGRRKSERIEKRKHMNSLKEEIVRHERRFEALVGVFLQPYVAREQQHARSVDSIVDSIVDSNPAINGRTLGGSSESLQDV